MNPLPLFLKQYFWDVEFDQLDIAQHSKSIIGRILDRGDEKAIQWMKENYSQDEMEDVLFHFRFVSPKSANFWAVIFDLPQEKILCLQKAYQQIQRRHWRY